jgi:HlyD family secretion protein
VVSSEVAGPELLAEPEEEKTSPRRSSRVLRWLRLALVLGLMAAAGYAAYRFASTPRAPAVRYRTAHLDRGPISAKVTANGTLSALVTVSVGSQVSGRVETLGADFGSKVEAGQVVATIEPAMFRAAAAQAKAAHAAALASVERANVQVANAERQFARARALRDEGLTTGADYETAEATLGVARADLRLARANATQTLAARDQAELNLRYTTIVSPIDGVVISRNVDVGQTVAAALQAPTLFTIAKDLTHMQVDTNVAEADVGKIRTGMPVSFVVDAYPDRVFRGSLRQVRDNAQALQNVVTYDAVVDVQNPEHLLKPGMTASVTFVYAERADVTRVPNAALRFRPDPAVVPELAAARARTSTRPDERVLFLLTSGTPRAVMVRVGISDGIRTELVGEGATPGAEAIVDAVSNGGKGTP